MAEGATIGTDFLRRLLFQSALGLRFTQDTPILPDVWAAFAREPHKPHDMIISPRYGVPSGQVARFLSEHLEARKRLSGSRIAYLPGRVVARLTFDDLVTLALTTTKWWRKRIAGSVTENPEEEGSSDEDNTLGPLLFGAQSRDWLVLHLEAFRRKYEGDIAESSSDYAGKRKFPDPDGARLTPDAIWLIRLVGMIAWTRSLKGNDLNSLLSETAPEEFETLPLQKQADYLVELYLKDRAELDDNQFEGFKAWRHRICRLISRAIAQAFLDLFRAHRLVDTTEPPMIWSLTLNRDAEPCIHKSTLAVKADAARRLFDINTSAISWAIIDSGINQNHPAFRDHKWPDVVKSRVRETLDFRGIRELQEPGLLRAFKRLKKFEDADGLIKRLLVRNGASEDQDDFEKAKDAVLPRLKEINRRLQKGFDIDWEDIEFLIHDPDPDPPVNDHGTHVAGILGADWREQGEDGEEDDIVMQGMCPEIKLIDIRVLRDDGRSDEFEVMAALQYLRYRNRRSGNMNVHGVNLSLSLRHEVANYACGRTPVCDECEKTVAEGMVVVAAAGNRGYSSDRLSRSGSHQYASTSITDPGNAEAVITVGSTHRNRPHNYGVSYFSSRGPTGDGRLKPDLVAPGEKIFAPVGSDDHDYKDGTSMAAPHVSGAAALLMARHKEMIGQPERVKQVLCNTATDLGRERYFQGHGMLDILRALQSI